PNKNFTGVINLLVGVRDQVNRVTGGDINSPDNFDTQKITLTVNNGAVVNLAPIALNGTTSVTINSPTPVQLRAGTSNPQSSQTLTYPTVTPPSHGVISNFNASTGAFVFTPNPNFAGTDTLTFRVRDVGAPTPNLDSNLATQTLVVGNGVTGAVRQIGRVLVVTPVPRTHGGTNTIDVT